MAPLTLLASGETQGQNVSDMLATISSGPADGTVSGTGWFSLMRPPTVLRMQIELVGRGKTVDAALANLKDRREAAIAQLEAMKADRASIEVGPPGLSNAASAQRQRYEQIIRQYSAHGQKIPAGLKVPKSFTISSTLEAEWPLPTDTPEHMLSTVVALQEKVEAADVAGVRDDPTLSPEERELEEEMTAMMRDYGVVESIPAGTPVFMFVARLSDEDRRAGMAEAFKRARAQAEHLAEAAGQPLGTLVGLGSGGDDELGGGESDESIGSDASPLSFVFVVQASFRLAEQGAP